MLPSHVQPRICFIVGTKLQSSLVYKASTVHFQGKRPYPRLQHNHSRARRQSEDTMAKKNKSQKQVIVASQPNSQQKNPPPTKPSQGKSEQTQPRPTKPQPTKPQKAQPQQSNVQKPKPQQPKRPKSKPAQTKLQQPKPPSQPPPQQVNSSQPPPQQLNPPQPAPRPIEILQQRQQLENPNQPEVAQRSIVSPLTTFASISDSTMSAISAQSSASTTRLPTPPGSISPSEDVPTSPGRTITAAFEELQLLDDASLNSCGQSRDHELRTAPIFTRDAYMTAGFQGHTAQYGVLGKVMHIYAKTSGNVPEDPRLYVNTNAPFSAIVCGVQGSGKSHTVSVLLENMLISNCTHIGSLEKPLCGLVLHFGEGGPSSRPCEASWVGVPSFRGVATPPIRVYVSRSSLNTMRAVYAPLGHRVIVEPLFFSEAELDAEAFLSMMAVGSSESAPLYVQLILSILRDLGENYTYREFMARLEECKTSFNTAQLAGLEQRMALLTSFMDPSTAGLSRDRPRFAPGQLTIIDLSDPFIDSASACGLFEIITRLFVRADVGTGKVLVVDEAHKYLSANKGNSGLTKSLLTLTREQRHLAMRVIISTQEPTVVPPVLLDLCTVAILHRFSSPSWWEHVAHHVSADVSAEEAFDKVVGLQTGEAVVLAPSGLSIVQECIPGVLGPPGSSIRKLGQLGRRYMVMKTRKRVTADGGASILVLDS